MKRRRDRLPVWIVWLLLAGACLVGCVSPLQQARKQEKQGRYARAGELYKTMAAQRTRPGAVQAQAGVVRMLVKQEKWTDVPMAASNLGSFLDPEDEWYQKHANNAPLYQSAQRTITQTLLTLARKSRILAKRIGSPQAWGATSGLYGTYLRYFPQGKYRAEAAAGKGEVLSLNRNCKSALKLFREALRRLNGQTLPSDSLPASTLRKVSKRGLLFCRIKGWLEEKQAKTTGGTAAAFASLLNEARGLLKESPQEVAKDLLQHARSLRQARAWPQALQLLLILIQSLPRHPLTMLAKQRALHMFGRTRNWAPLLAAMTPVMPKDTSGISKSRFWRRVQTLSVLHGARRAKRLLAQKRDKEAAYLLLSVSRWGFALKHSRVALYRATLKLEERKRYRAAGVVYKRLYENDPSHRLSMMALYRYARVLEKQRYNSMAASAYERLARNHPKSIIASRSLYRAWKIYRVQRRKDKRQSLRSWILRKYPGSMEAARVRRRR